MVAEAEATPPPPNLEPARFWEEEEESVMGRGTRGRRCVPGSPWFDAWM